TRSSLVLMAARSSLLRRVCSRMWRGTIFSPSTPPPPPPTRASNSSPVTPPPRNPPACDSYLSHLGTLPTKNLDSAKHLLVQSSPYRIRAALACHPIG